MSLKPLRGYVLVEQIDDTGTTASGLVMPETAKDKPMKGRIIAIGAVPTSLKDELPYVWEVQKDQVVIFKKWGGQDIDDKLKLVRFDELMGVYE
jgi:chaperonin GroES